jgi:hypothetical protein
MNTKKPKSETCKCGHEEELHSNEIDCGCQKYINFRQVLCSCAKFESKVQPKSDWEEEFARDFFNDDSWNVNHYHVVKDFIRNQIRAERLAVLDKIEAAYNKYDMTEDIDPSAPMLRMIAYLRRKE